MKRQWLMGVVALVVSAGNLGCYYDQWAQAKRDNGVLREELAQRADDLQSCELMNQQKETTINSLRNELAAKDQQIANLTQEKQHWRDAFDKAQAILQEQANKGPGTTVVMGHALPAALHEKLKEFALKHPKIVEYDEAKGAVRWKADLLFPSGKDTLVGSPEVMDSLKEFAAIVNSAEAAGFDVIVVGHTDTDPIKHSADRFRSNWDLSAYRSIAVMNMMAEQKVAMARMGIMGYGEHRPIAENTSEQGKAKNRRVEIYLVSRDAVQSVSQGLKRVNGTDLAFLPVSER